MNFTIPKFAISSNGANMEQDEDELCDVTRLMSRDCPLPGAHCDVTDHSADGDAVIRKNEFVHIHGNRFTEIVYQDCAVNIYIK